VGLLLVGWPWIEAGLTGLAKRHNPLLEQIVPQGKLRLAFADNQLDCVDVHSASFVGAALDRGASICLVLPDAQRRRPAFLFAYALLWHWWKDRNLDFVQRRPVLYCGVETGIREHLSHVSVAGMRGSLASAFSQTHLLRGANGAARDGGLDCDPRLPSVVTAYSPADPRGLVATLRPAWIAVDLSDAPSLPWLLDLLDAAKAHNIPVLAWGTNLLSEVVSQFTSADCNVVKWPSARAFAGQLDFAKKESADVLFQPYIITNVRPLMPAGRHLSVHNAALIRAGEFLQTLSSATAGTLLHGAIQQHWRLLRMIENLSVPFAFYEAEAGRFWGLSSVERIQSTCAQLRSALEGNQRSAAAVLENVGQSLSDAIGVVRDCDPPLWSALTNLLHQDPPDGYGRVVVFPTRSRKELFTLALLARLNIVEADLVPLRNWVMTLEELGVAADRDWPEMGEPTLPQGVTILPTLVALPSALQMPKLWPLFLAEETDVLIHGYQRGLLAYRVRRLDDEMSPDMKAISRVIADLVPLLQPETAPTVSNRIVSLDASTIDIDDRKYSLSAARAPEPLWRAGDETDEIGRLFEPVERELVGDEPSESDADLTVDPAACVESAYEIQFSGGWRGMFEADDRLNYINHATIDPRYVRSLRAHDNVLIIPYQRRQSLYSLVIARVHQHKNMQLPLALLRRWHDELLVGFESWRRRGTKSARHTESHAAELLLSEMKKLGTTLTSHQAIQFWVREVTLAPVNKEDLYRVAQILEMRFTSQHYERIAAAASRIRGLHRGLSNRLGHWLADRAQGVGDTHDRVVLDTELGLTFGDIRASFIIAEIVRIHEVKGVFLRGALGIIQRG
jgi:hypothetical protein